MKRTIVYNGKPYPFELVSVGGDTPPTVTQGLGNIQKSSLVVALDCEVSDMETLFLLLVTLTRNAWEGMIVFVPELNTRPPELTSWQVRRSRPKEGERGVYICTVGYKTNMPTQSVNYTIGD